MRTTRTTSIEELLGAYALGAVGPRERAVVDAHLPTCATCVIELAGHLRVAAALVAEPHLADRALAPAPGRPRRRQLARAGAGAFVVVAVLSVVVLAWSNHDDRRQVDALRTEMARTLVADQSVTAFVNSADRRIVLVLVGANHQLVLTAVIRPDGSGLLIDRSLPALPTTKTYELWRLDNNVVVPAPVEILGTHPLVAEFGITTRTVKLIVTVEPSPGATPSPNPAVAEGFIPS